MNRPSISRRPQITVVMEAPLKSALAEKARQEGRSISNLMRKIAQEYLHAGNHSAQAA